MKKLIFAKKAIIGILVLAIIAGCNSFIKPEIKGIQEISVKQFSLTNIEIDALVVVHNPNKHPITIQSAEFDIFIKEKMVGDLLLKDEVTIGSNSDMDCPSRLIVDSQEGMKLGIKALKKLNSGELKIRLKGSISGRFGILKRKLIIDEEL